MAHVVLTASADADSAAIFGFLNRKAGTRSVLKYRAFFTKLYDHLSRYPKSGSPRPALGPDVRIGVVPPYVVIYDYTPAADLVTILRIVDGRRRITLKLLSE